MLAEYSSELSQQRAGVMENSQPSSGTSGSGGNAGLCRHLDGAVYISACATKMDTIVFMHKWSVAQFSAQQELSSPGDFIESKLVLGIFAFLCNCYVTSAEKFLS